MSECEYQQELSAYFDGELPIERGVVVEQHLRTCAACAAELALIRKMSGVLGSIERPAMSAQAMGNLHATIEEIPDRSLARFALRISAVAAAVMLAGAGWLVAGAESQGASAEPIASWEAVAAYPGSSPLATNSDTQLAEFIVSDLSRAENR